MANPLKLLANLRRFDGSSDPSTYLQTEFRQNLKAIEDAFNNTGNSLGNIGEYVETASSGQTPFGASGTPFYKYYIDLSPGDWELSMQVLINRNGATTSSDITAWIGSDPSTGGVFKYYDLTVDIGVVSVANAWVLKTSGFRQKIDATTRYYVTINCSYSSATPFYSHRLSARRFG